MNIYKRRVEFARLFQRELSGSTIVVSSPNHPLLLQGPDLLVASEGGLLMVFIVKRAERSSWRSLETRLALSRAAYPANATTALLMNSATDDGLLWKAQTSFEAVEDVAEPRKLLSLARDPRGLPKSKSDDLLREAIRERFVITYGVSTRYAETAQAPELTDLSASNRATTTKLRPEFNKNPAADIQAVKAQRMLRTTSKDMFRLVETGARQHFNLDNGIAYPNSEPSGLRMVHRLPKRQGDVNQSVRAAAFAGFALMPFDHEADMDEARLALSETARFHL